MDRFWLEAHTCTIEQVRGIDHVSTNARYKLDLKLKAAAQGGWMCNAGMRDIPWQTSAPLPHFASTNLHYATH